MDFFYYKSKTNTFDAKTVIFNGCGEQTIQLADGSVLKYVKHCEHVSDEAAHVVFCGKVRYEKQDAHQSKQTFFKHIATRQWPLPNTISGYFSGFYIEGDTVRIFTDPIGMYNMFYYCDGDKLIISSTLSTIQEATQAKINFSGLVLETMSHFSQFGRMTVLEGVNRLMPGELLEIVDHKVTGSLFDLTIKSEDTKPPKKFHNELVELINDESELMYEDNILISLSGGIDSRINLAPLIVNGKKIHAINYGIKDQIDSKIPFTIAKKMGFDITLIDPMPNLFPKSEVVHDIIERTDSLHMNMWHSILVNEDFKGSTFLLGDMIDILRAKSVSSLKTRKFRTAFYTKKFLFGKKLELIPLTPESLQQFKDKKLQTIQKNVRHNFRFFYFDEDTQDDILEKVIADVKSLFAHLDKYNCRYVESYEELFTIFTSGRLFMGKQLNILKYKFKAEIPLANIKILRKVLNVSPDYRYADELTSKMFNHKSWKRLGNFPTSQNPFVRYNANLFLMLFGWFMRSRIDFMIIKANLFTKGKFNRSRLVKSFNSQASYAFPEAFENYKSYFVKNKICNFQEKVEAFQKRKEKKAWPLASMDLMPYVQVMYYVKRFGIK